MDVKSTTSIPTIPIATSGDSKRQRRDEPKPKKPATENAEASASPVGSSTAESSPDIVSQSVVDLLEKASEPRHQTSEKPRWNVKESTTETPEAVSKLNKSL